jgi:hypothetical protein
MPTERVTLSSPDPSTEPMTLTPPPTLAPPETSQVVEQQYEQRANPGVDSEAIRRDRGVQHSSGSHN